MARTGRDMGYTSHEVKNIFKQLKKGNKTYAPNCILCKEPGCRSGFKVDVQTGKFHDCEKCKGYGFIRKM